jgi:rubredoxin
MYYDELYDTAYCRNCGKEVRPVKVRVPCEEFDYPRTGMKDVRVSGCCQDELSPDPVTDICAMCGETAGVDGERFEEVDGDKMCPQCKSTSDSGRVEGG